MWKNPMVALAAGALLGFLGGYLVGQGQPMPAPPVPAPAPNPHAGVPGAPPLGGAAAGGAQGMPDPQLTRTLRDIEALLAKEPSNYDLLVRAGNTLYDMSSYRRAIDYYERARAIRDDSPDVLTDEGVCYRETGNPEQAAARFQKAVQLAPTHWQSRFNLLVVKLFDQNDPLGAERELAGIKQFAGDAIGLPDLAPIEKEIAARKAGAAPAEKP